MGKTKIKDLKNRVDLYTYAKTQLGMSFTKKYGKLRSWDCPFCATNEDKKNSPPFAIHDPKKYKCFRCGSRGDILSLVQEIHNTDVNGAVNHLQKYIGGDVAPIKIIRKEADNASKEKEADRKQKTVETILANSNYAKESELSVLLRGRGFGALTRDAVTILRKQRICINTWDKNEENFGCKDTLVIEIAHEKTTAIQKIGIKKSPSEKHEKRIYGKVDGYYVATPLAEKHKEIIIVESFFCAVALAAAGYTAVAIFSAHFTKNIELVKERFSERKIYLWLDEGEMERKKTFDCIKEHEIRGIFWKKGAEKGFDVNDLLKESHKKFPEQIRNRVKKSLPEKGMEPITFFEPDNKEYRDISSMSEHIRSLRKKELLLFSAPTGTGKTYLYASEIIKMYCDIENEITVLTNSIKGVDNIIEKIKSAAKIQGIEDISISRNVADRTTDENFDPESIGRIAVTTYASLGRKGHTDVAKPAATALIKDRIIFCDEVQSLIEGVCKVNIPLSSRYRKDKATYRKASKCPVKRNNPNACASCLMTFRRESPDKFNKLNFPKSFSETDKENNLNCELLTEMFDGLWDVNTYENDEGVFNKFLEESVDYELSDPREIDEEKEDDLIFFEFIQDIISKMKYPQLSMVSPSMIDTGSPITPSAILEIEQAERTKAVKFPEQACQIPHLKGFDILPILQILQASKIIMCSATIPEETHKLLDDVISKKEWSMKFEQVDIVKVTFHATFLTTDITLSENTQVKLCELLKHKTLIAAKTKDICGNIYRGASSDKIEKYSSGDFEDNARQRKSKTSEKKDITVTYLRSALLTGLDYPEKDVMIIDCLSFYPQIVCTERDKDLRKAEMVRQLQTMITQAIGRVLRTTKEKREQGQDDRSIVFILHGLTYNIEIDKRLFHYCSLVKDIFITEKKRYFAINNAIDEARRGVVVSDYRAMENSEKQRVANHKYSSCGKNKMSKSQRKNVTLSPSEKKKMKLEGKVNALIEKAKVFEGSWSDFYKSNRVDRIPKSKQKNISQAFENK